jgi:ADP-ribose pyrophosphatase YjhB (NUDIX family)
MESGGGPTAVFPGRTQDLADIESVRRYAWRQTERASRRISTVALSPNGRIKLKALYKLVQRLTPLPCVDILLHRERGAAREVGLIYRRVPESPVSWGEKTGWTLVGGRVWLGETIEEAIHRHLQDSLVGVDWSALLKEVNIDYDHPAAVGEYFPDDKPTFPVDPRQHSIALSFLVPVDEAVDLKENPDKREAKKFDWFPENEALAVDIGFRQEIVVEKLLKHLKQQGLGMTGNNG